MATPPPAGALLLRYLDARVRRDRAIAGIVGRVVVCVRGLNGPRFWVADFGDQTKTYFTNDKPTSYSVAVGLDDDGARALLGLPTFGAPEHLVAGDCKLLGRFVERYLRDVSPLKSRIGAMALKPQAGR